MHYYAIHSCWKLGTNSLTVPSKVGVDRPTPIPIVVTPLMHMQQYFTYSGAANAAIVVLVLCYRHCVTRENIVY